jgi:hypothetical protein
MAFILPIVAVGSSVGSFLVGYYFNSNNTCSTEHKEITVDELKKLKYESPHKEIYQELVTFDKKTLKKPDVINVKLTQEQELMENLRKKILNRRVSIE